MDATPVQKVVVVVDLARYSDIVGSLQVRQKLGVEATQFVNDQIRSLSRKAVEQTGADFANAYVKSTGDGAILVFDDPSEADRFGAALHAVADTEHNRQARYDTEFRCFRIGVYAGEVVLTLDDIHGVAVGTATRLEHEAQTGEIYGRRFLRAAFAGKAGCIRIGRNR